MPNTYTIKLTGDQWEIFTASMKCGNAARGMNAVANKAVKSARKMIAGGVGVRDALVAAFDEAMVGFQKFSDYGATDSEPRYKLERELCKALGVDHMELY